MANVKITQLPLATTPLTGTEDIPLVQGTTTKQVTVTGLFTSPVMTNPTLGTVGQADLINATGLPIASGVAGLGAGIATFLGTPSSANLRTAVTDETGTGSLVFANAPVLVAPDLGTPTFLVATNATGTAVGLTAGSAITNANLTGAVTSVGNATSLGSFTSAQLRTALTDETGAGSAVFATSPTITAPILNQINDTNNAQILGLSPTTSAVDYLVVKNGIGVGVPLHFYADGSSANIGLHIQPKGTGLVTISDGTDFNKGIRFRSSSSAASAVTLLDAVSTAGRVVTLPDATTTLVGRDTTDTLTNKTIAFSSNTFSGTLAIANGGTNASTAASAIENLLPSYTGNGSKGLRLNSGATALEWVADGGGTVTSVAASVPSFLSIAGSPITTSGTLAFTLSGTALPTTSGGTGLTSFTSGGVVYASSSSALATGSALTFDGTTLLSSAGFSTGIAGGGSYKLNYASNVDSRTWRLINDQNVFGDFAIQQSTTQTGTTYRAVYSALNDGTQFWAVGGSEQMRLTSTGLGIGTSSPTYKLDVTGAVRFGSTASAPYVYVGSLAGNYSGGLQFNISTTQYNWAIGANDQVGNSFTITPSTATGGSTYSTPAFVLNSSGNLGLGVTPSAWGSGYKALQINNSGIVTNTSGTFIAVASNAYFDGTNYKYVSSAAASLYRQNAGVHDWNIAASGTANTNISFTQAMTLDASGNLGIGVTSPDASTRLDIQATNARVRVKATSTGSALYTTNNTGGTFYTGLDDSGGNTFGVGAYSGVVWNGANTPIVFATNNTERARIDSSGNLLVGTTSASGSGGLAKLTLDGARECAVLISSGGASYSPLFIWNTATSGDNYFAYFSTEGGSYPGTNRGSISYNRTAGLTAYNTTSDYRAKEIIGPVTNSGALIDSVPVYMGKMKDATQERPMFIAHEVPAYAHTGVKDAVDADGNPVYQQMDASALIPVMWAEIQSLRQRLSAANL